MREWYFTEEEFNEAQLKQKKQKRIIFAILFSLLVLGIAIWAAFPGCMVHSFSKATCTKPKTCSVCGATRGEALGHSWLAASCSQAKTCEVCGTTDGKPLPHKWIKATCKAPKQCKICGATSGKKLNHQWSEETVELPKKCKLCGKILPKDTPENGEVLFSNKKRSLCQIVINNESTDCFVKLKDEDDNDVIGFFVRADQTAEVSVPTGSYYAYFAFGDKWYGTKYLFGKNTKCSMDEEIRDYWASSKQYGIRTYTLYKVSNGNFTPKEIDIFDF